MSAPVSNLHDRESLEEVLHSVDHIAPRVSRVPVSDLHNRVSLKVLESVDYAFTGVLATPVADLHDGGSFEVLESDDIDGIRRVVAASFLNDVSGEDDGLAIVVVLLRSDVDVLLGPVGLVVVILEVVISDVDHV